MAVDGTTFDLVAGWNQLKLPPTVSGKTLGAVLRRLPSLNCVVPEHHPAPSHLRRRAGWNVVISPDGDPLRMHRRRVGLEVTELLLLLLGVQPPFNGFSPGA
ncbi:hypothetical protein OBA47_01715 [bacterium]|nr:hypothetical protein [bacterium]